MNDLIKTKVPYSQKYLTVVSVVSKLLRSMVVKKRDPKVEKAKLEEFILIG